MGFELQDVVNDPDLAESFIILRQSGKFAAGGWKSSTPQQINAWGVVSVASAKELNMVPQSDRIVGSRMFISETAMYTTSETRGLTSDVLVWGRENYRVISVGEYQNRGGYYYAIAVRMAGQ